jgi:hypothetical protein
MANHDHICHCVPAREVLSLEEFVEFSSVCARSFALDWGFHHGRNPDAWPFYMTVDEWLEAHYAFHYVSPGLLSSAA